MILDQREYGHFFSFYKNSSITFALYYLRRLLQKTKGSTVYSIPYFAKFTKCPMIIKQNIFAGKLQSICVAKEISKMQYIKDKLKYHGYNYCVYCQEMAQENGIIPHIDLSAAAVQFFLKIPILIIQTNYIHNPTSNKKEWFCTAHEALGTTIDLDIHSYKIMIVDDNDGFVGATALIPITHLKEDISMVDNLKYTIESVQCWNQSPREPNFTNQPQGF